MKKYAYLIYPSLALLLFIIWTTLVKVVDQHYIQGVGFLGFYSLNTSINDFIIKQNYGLFHTLTNVLLILSILTVVPFAVMGIVQLVVRKSLKKVDSFLYCLLGTYVMIVIFYFVFELVKINFSPLSTPEDLKPSYPSTHVFIFITLICTSLLGLFHYVKLNNIIRITLIVLTSALCAMMTTFRLFSLHHYFTDIVGGFLLAITLVISFTFLVKFIKDDQKGEN